MLRGKKKFVFLLREVSSLQFPRLQDAGVSALQTQVSASRAASQSSTQFLQPPELPRRHREFRVSTRMTRTLSFVKWGTANPMHTSENLRAMHSSHLPLIAAIIVLLPGAVMAQQERIPGKINTSQWSTLRGNIHPNVRSTYDQGRVDDALEMSSVMLVVKPSASQQAALDQLLADLQNPTSAAYRHRSEERRVGKECRCRGSPQQE